MIIFLNVSYLVGGENEIDFDTLNISAKQIKNNEKTFIMPGAISSRDEIGSQTQSIDSIVRSISGSYTNTDQSQGTVQVNIRGMTGLGRVNTMIDGVTQTFFGTSADNGKFHTGEGTLGNSSFGAPIDKNFLVSVDVEKGSFHSGSSGLMGSANFKTIGVDDIVRDGNTFGFLGRFGYGTNKVGPNYMGSVAAKTELNNGYNVGALFGYAGKKLKQNYKTGGGDNIEDKKILNETFDPAMPESDWNKKYIDVSPFNPKELTQKPNSYIFKFELNSNDDIKSILSYRKYDNELAGRKINHDTYQFDLNYNPISELINLDFLIAYNKGTQKYNKNATIFSRSDITNGLSAKNKALTIDISNELKFDFMNNIFLTLKPGVNYIDNKYTNSIDYENTPGAYATPFQPKGKQKIKTLYLDTNFEYDILSIATNFSLTNWELSGFKPECDVNTNCFPKAATDIKKSDTNFNYSTILSAQLHDLFSPFITYSKTTRAPNIQEMFFGSNYGNSVNPFLKPEVAKTWQIGFNSFKHGLLSDNDSFGFKVLYYKTKVDDYIYNKSFYTTDKFTLHLNSANTVTLKGVEAELSYDMGSFFVNASYSHEKSDAPTNETYGGDMFGYGKIAKLPEDYATINVGTRLFNEKLTLGAIIKYTGKAKRIHPNDYDLGREPTDDPNDLFASRKEQDLPNIPTIYDLYATYKYSDNFNLKFEVQNVFDKDYVDALNAFSTQGNQEQYDSNWNELYIFSNKARGRTFLASFEYRY
ncbi:TonB-dependent receptor [Campylobacter blaseri]|uniref:TonB-dependent receptor n=1 Tax=Campylobacter blaseri TaxID=2042961 RepID=A0A2P8R480_9BACT|nr:TonB-dependent receptor [Campylobacter blaseri]PSM54784.1 TonB-dependent receptor [Campylobacter blaseri]